MILGFYILVLSKNELLHQGIVRPPFVSSAGGKNAMIKSVPPPVT